MERQAEDESGWSQLEALRGRGGEWASCLQALNDAHRRGEKWEVQGHAETLVILFQASPSVSTSLIHALALLNRLAEQGE